jgi:hypothetical protein
MSHFAIEHEVVWHVGHYKDHFVVAADCTPTDEKDVFDIRVVVKSKSRNRRRIHKGQIEINNPANALNDIRDYIKYGNIVDNMLSELSLVLLKDYPEFYPPIDNLE